MQRTHGLAEIGAAPREVHLRDYWKVLWQGRYTLPLLAGLPVLAGWALDRHRAALRDVLPRLLGPLVVVLTVGL